MPLKIILRKQDGTLIEKEVIYQNNQFGVMFPMGEQEYFCRLNPNKMNTGQDQYKINHVIKEDGTEVPITDLNPPNDSYEVISSGDRIYLLKNSYAKGVERTPEGIWRADNAGNMQAMEQVEEYNKAAGYIFWQLTGDLIDQLITSIDSGQGTGPVTLGNGYGVYYNMNKILTKNRDAGTQNFDDEKTPTIVTPGFMANSNDPGVEQFNAYLAHILSKKNERPLRLLVPLGVKGGLEHNLEGHVPHMNGLVVDIDGQGKVNILVYDPMSEGSAYNGHVQTKFLDKIRLPDGYNRATITKNPNRHQSDLECGHHTLNFLEFAHKNFDEKDHNKLLDRYNTSLNNPDSLVQNGSAADAKAEHRQRLIAFRTEIESHKNALENELNPGSRDLSARQAESRDRAAASTPSQARPTSNANLLAPTAMQKIEAFARDRNWKVEKTNDKMTIDNIGGNKDNKVIVEKNIIRMSANEESYKAGAEIAKELINDSKGVGKKEILGLKLSNASNDVKELAKMANAYLEQGVAVYIEPPHLLAQVKVEVKTEYQGKLQSEHERLSEKLSARPSDPMRKAAAQNTPPDEGGVEPRPVPRP